MILAWICFAICCARRLSLPIFFAFRLIAPQYTSQTISPDYGTWKIQVNNDEISIIAYSITKKIKNNIIKYTQNYYPKFQKYRHELYLVSKSVFNGDTTNTWIYGTKIFIDDIEVTKKQFPDGFIFSIKIEPTLIYWFETKNKLINFIVTWEKSMYEPRIYK